MFGQPDRGTRRNRVSMHRARDAVPKAAIEAQYDAIARDFP
jgi:hypothetical protein